MAMLISCCPFYYQLLVPEIAVHPHNPLVRCIKIKSNVSVALFELSAVFNSGCSTHEFRKFEFLDSREINTPKFGSYEKRQETTIRGCLFRTLSSITHGMVNVISSSVEVFVKEYDTKKITGFKIQYCLKFVFEGVLSKQITKVIMRKLQP